MSYKAMLQSGILINNNIKIIELIGYGGQGEVYKVEYQKKLYALKWYYPHIATERLKKSLFNLIIKGSPNDNFLWPISLIEYKNQFGYLMELRPATYRSLYEWINLEFDMSFTNISKACFKLTDAFHKLHAAGFSYKDISLDNIFIEPSSGNILICDNDNITPNGINVSGLLGTPKFMAPEIVMGKSNPNTETDQFSLAVLLFYILIISHPLEGEMETKIKCFDSEAAKLLYGTEAVFIYDKNNDTNRPVEGIHNNALNLWKLYPDYIKELFHQTFTIGIKNPNERTRESKFRSAFLRMYNSIYKCPICKTEIFYDENNTCFYCKNEFLSPLRLVINKNEIVLDDNKEIFVCHVNDNEPSNTNILGKIKLVGSLYYLINLSENIWTINSHKIYPNQEVELNIGNIINFGKVKGEIRKKEDELIWD